MGCGFADRRDLTVSLLSLRNYTRCACGFGYGCYGTCRFERDSCSDVPDQDERCQSLNVVVKSEKQSTKTKRWHTRRNCAKAA
jgi:hypothetical protein